MVISDLHVGEKAKPDELKPASGVWNTRTGFLNQFNELLTSSHLTVDALVISGDITNVASPAEVSHANKLIEWVISRLHIGHTAVLAIPGNHDLHWGVCNIDDSGKGFWSQFRFAAFTHQQGALQGLMNRGGKLFSSPHFLIKKTERLIFCGINSASIDYPSTRPHHGGVDNACLQALDKALSQLPLDPTQYRVCAVHHHPLNYSDLDPNYADFSALTNAENLLRILIKHNFDFLVHGHKHVPFFTIHTREGSRMLPILGAGSFSANLVEPLYQGRVVNQLHLIEFAGRDPTTNVAYGRVRTWAHITTSGWVPSLKEHHGISHLNGFGRYDDYRYVVDVVRSVLLNALTRRSYVTGAELFVLNGDFQYIPRELFSQVVSEVCAAQKWGIVGTVDELERCTIITSP
jgi:3',5'-cyclic AMP phosphodiesterase CpdA